MVVLDFDLLAEQEERLQQTQSHLLQDLGVAAVALSLPLRLQDHLLHLDTCRQGRPVLVLTVDLP